MNTINTAQASLSLTGASSLTMGGVIAVSWSASLFLGTLENYIPNTMPKTKIVISATKFTVSLPIRCVEFTGNAIFGTFEKLIVGMPLPTNITEVYKLNVGPNLKNVQEFKKPILNWLIKLFKTFEN